MTAPLPLPIAPFAMMGGDRASAGKIRPGEGNDPTGESLAGFAFGPLLQQILHIPGGHGLSEQTAHGGNMPNPALVTTATGAAGGKTPLADAQAESVLGRPPAAGHAGPPTDASPMRLVATLPAPARAPLAGGPASSSSVAQGAVPVTAGFMPAVRGAVVPPDQPGTLDGQTSRAPSMSTPPFPVQIQPGDVVSMSGAPETVREEGMAPSSSVLLAAQPAGTPTQAAATLPERADVTALRAVGLENEPAGDDRAVGIRPERDPPPAPVPVPREGAGTARPVIDVHEGDLAVTPSQPTEPLAADDGHSPPAEAEQTPPRPAAGPLAPLAVPDGTTLTNLMQPAEPGLRLAPLAEERAPAKLLRAKMTAGRRRPVAGVVSPSLQPRPEAVGPHGPQPAGRHHPITDASAGLAVRSAATAAAPASAEGFHSSGAPLHAPGAGGERIHADIPAPAGQLAAAPAQAAAGRHPPALAQALPQSSHTAGAASSLVSAGDGLAPLSEGPTAAALPLSSAHGGSDGLARPAAASQQPMTGHQQPAAAQLGLALQYRIGRQETKFALRLDPPELGRVDVSLKLHEGGRVEAVIRTEHSHTLDLLQRDVRVLERAFHQLGLKPEGGIQFASGQQGHGHSGSPFSQPQQDGMGQPPGGGGYGEGGREQPASEMAQHTAGPEAPERAIHDDGSQEQPMKAATVGLDVKV